MGSQEIEKKKPNKSRRPDFTFIFKELVKTDPVSVVKKLKELGLQNDFSPAVMAAWVTELPALKKRVDAILTDQIYNLQYQSLYRANKIFERLSPQNQLLLCNTGFNLFECGKLPIADAKKRQAYFDKLRENVTREFKGDIQKQMLDLLNLFQGSLGTGAVDLTPKG